MTVLRPSVQRFAEAMELRLRRNDHKGGWHDMTPSDCYNRAMDEAHELWRALGPNDREADPTKVRWEAEDAANFLMMCWEQAATHCQGP